MSSSDNETPAVDIGRSLSGWELGIVPPKRRRRTVLLPGKMRCAVCGCGISDHQWRLFQTCDFWKCQAQHRRQRRELKKEMEKRRQRQQENFKRRVRLLRNKAAGLLGVDGPERFVCAVVPALQRPVSPLPEERRPTIGNHLNGLIAEIREKQIAYADDPPYESEPAAVHNGNSEPLPVVGQACAACQGNCCVQGGDRAYLDVETIPRFLKKHPELEAADLVEWFLSHVEAYTYEDSCIYHGVNGCSLPRDARSTTCNGFECTGVRRLKERLTGQGPHRAFLIAAEKNQAVRYDFVHV
jgi:CDGSH-type Zn-finger protein